MQLALWCAEYFETTGQAIVTRRVAEHILPTLGRHREYVYRRAGSLQAVASWFAVTTRLYGDLIRGRIGVLYLVCSRSNAGFLRDIPALIAARFDVRVVVHAHGSDIQTLLTKGPLSPLARVLYRACELVLPSHHLVAPLEGRLAALHVCENFAIGDEAFATVTQQSSRDLLSVLWNSNIMASKGVFDVMQAVGVLCDEGANVKLQMIGAVMGDEELPMAAVNQKFSSLKNNNWIVYHGRVSAKRAAELSRETDVVLLPSRYSSECQPLAVIDAMCAGKAIIVSDIPALRATAGDYPAEFVPIHSVDDVVKVLRRLYDEKRADPSAFVARRAGPAANAGKRFSTQRFDQQMKAILSTISKP